MKTIIVEPTDFIILRLRGSHVDPVRTRAEITTLSERLIQWQKRGIVGNIVHDVNCDLEVTLLRHADTRPVFERIADWFFGRPTPTQWVEMKLPDQHKPGNA